MSIARHAALKIIRKRKGLETVSLEEATEARTHEEIRHPEYIADWSQSPEELAPGTRPGGSSRRR